MPLANLGLVSQFDASDAQRLTAAAPRSERVVRCVAGFYPHADQAASVAAALRNQFGLHATQLTVIQPAGLTRRAFATLAERWRQLRPRWGWTHVLGQLTIGATVGMLSGGTAALLGWMLLGDTGLEPDAWDWLQPGLWIGALAGMVTATAVSVNQPRHRFDDTVVRKLHQGYCVVVAHRLTPHDEAPVLAYLQDTSHSWCAEAPARQSRL